MPQDVDAGDERPDTIGDHEWNNILCIRVGKKAEGAHKIKRVVPESARGHKSPFVPCKCKECKQCRADAEDLDWLHCPIIPCVGGETGVGPRRKAGGAWRRGGVAQNFNRNLCGRVELSFLCRGTVTIRLPVAYETTALTN